MTEHPDPLVREHSATILRMLEAMETQQKNVTTLMAVVKLQGAQIEELRKALARSTEERP